jgi:exodeoxyribonuclease-5
MSLTGGAGDLQLTGDQKRAQEAIMAFFSGQHGQLLKVGGFAGTGKTTIVAETIEKLLNRPRIAFCAFTGKAASVLKRKLDARKALRETDYCGTIHGLIYTPFMKEDRIGGWKEKSEADREPGKEVARKPVMERTSAPVGFKKNETIPYDFIIVDEASMLREDLYDDLASFGAPVLAVGDHGQLYPVGDDFSLMRTPDIRLEQIHRQAEGHPIIRMSIMARESGYIPIGEYGPGVEKVRERQRAHTAEIGPDTMFLCGINTTRVFYNNFIRERLGFRAQDPEVGEKIICLKNNREKEIYNGMTGTLTSLTPKGDHWYDVVVDMEDGREFADWVFKHQFGSVYPIFEYEKMPPWQIRNLFDWGYCLTVHKSQGSEAKSVVVIEERVGRMSNEDWSRWLYTAVTRAREKLLVIGS